MHQPGKVFCPLDRGIAAGGVEEGYVHMGRRLLSGPGAAARRRDRRPEAAAAVQAADLMEDAGRRDCK